MEETIIDEHALSNMEAPSSSIRQDGDKVKWRKGHEILGICIEALQAATGSRQAISALMHVHCARSVQQKERVGTVDTWLFLGSGREEHGS